VSLFNIKDFPSLDRLFVLLLSFFVVSVVVLAVDVIVVVAVVVVVGEKRREERFVAVVVVVVGGGGVVVAVVVVCHRLLLLLFSLHFQRNTRRYCCIHSTTVIFATPREFSTTITRSEWTKLLKVLVPRNSPRVRQPIKRTANKSCSCGQPSKCSGVLAMLWVPSAAPNRCQGVSPSIVRMA